jgi:cysteine desulfurase
VGLPVYLDNLATTPVDRRVIDAMLPFFTEDFGNPASKTHVFGWKAAEAAEQARIRVATLIGARSAREIVFTSGATEANNLALKGVAEFYRGRGNHLITCATEHKSVLDCCRGLEQRGCEVTYLPVDSQGRIDVGRLRDALTPRTVLISLMAANNEIGTIQPLTEIGAVAKEREILWHCDAVQAAGKFPLDVEALGVDLLSISAHKMYAAKGAGALYVRSRRPRVRLQPQIEGGGQERGIRSGTLNVPGLVGLGTACQLCLEGMAEESERLSALRDRLYQGLVDRLDGVRLNGHPRERLPGCLNLSFAGVDGAALLTAFRDIALSAGSACTSGEGSPSHVLRAIGLPDDLAYATLRFGLGRFNHEQEIDYVIGRVVAEVKRLRGGG